MSRIGPKDTKPEKTVRSLLHNLGYRFRLHCDNLPGKPDIVMKKYRTVIFIHGCFWHQHNGCKNAVVPKTNTEKWILKLTKNKERDLRNNKMLSENGWNVLTIWECETEKPETLRTRLLKIKSEL